VKFGSDSSDFHFLKNKNFIIGPLNLKFDKIFLIFRFHANKNLIIGAKNEIW